MKSLIRSRVGRVRLLPVMLLATVAIGVSADHDATTAQTTAPDRNVAVANPNPAIVGNPLPTEPYILTPPAPPTPRINGPDVFGVRPNSPFLYRIPATGERPMTFSVTGLPSGLSVD